jgi:hypothetical protein
MLAILPPMIVVAEGRAVPAATAVPRNKVHTF